MVLGAISSVSVGVMLRPQAPPFLELLPAEGCGARGDGQGMPERKVARHSGWQRDQGRVQGL